MGPLDGAIIRGEDTLQIFEILKNIRTTNKEQIVQIASRLQELLAHPDWNIAIEELKAIYRHASETDKIAFLDGDRAMYLEFISRWLQEYISGSKRAEALPSYFLLDTRTTISTLRAQEMEDEALNRQIKVLANQEWLRASHESIQCLREAISEISKEVNSSFKNIDFISQTFISYYIVGKGTPF
ncbi:MAG: hypothetical protein HYZ54_13990 [Ignavibacteriae bacterium]|nr:hypothetical protein [Ignavibacteriota bacterium]